MDLNPFDAWKQQPDAPNEDEQHASQLVGWTESRDETGKVTITITPTPQARGSAAVLGGYFQALQDAGFTRDEALTLLRESMSGVVILSDGDDDDE